MRRGRTSESRARARGVALLPALVGMLAVAAAPGCGVFRLDEAPAAAVADESVLSFARRIESFYRSLEELPIDSLITYEDPKLRTHFRDQTAFADYYASLAHQVRAASFRNGRAERVEVEEFRFEGPELARVEVRVYGRHQRALRFWEIDFARTDTWRRVEGAWVLTPEKL